MYKKIILFIGRLFFMTVFMFACSELDKTTDIYPGTSEADPVISSVSPDSAVNGVMDITINGENFSGNVDENFVYFGSGISEVLSATPTQLVVRRPIGIGGLYTIKAVKRSAFLPAEFPSYSLEPGVISLRDGETYNSVTVGNGDSLFAESDEIIYLIQSNGERTEYCNLGFVSSEMRMGPAGVLYVQRKENRALFTVPAGGGEAVQLTRVRRNSSVFDFDSEGYIYSGGERSGFSVTTPDGVTSTEYELYDGNYRITGLRVFDGYVYVAADTLLDVDEDGFFRAIYRHELLGSGEMGDQELVFHWTNEAGAYAIAAINDITFSDDGKMYIATDASNPIVILTPERTLKVLYQDVIDGPIFQLAWGSGNYLFLNRVGAEDSDSGLLRIIMGQHGAPYFGRM